MSDSNKLTGHAPLPPEVASKLLDLLSTDDRFRELFRADPAAALAEAGHPTAGEHIGKTSISSGDTFYCMTSEELASKEEIAQSREQLEGFLTTFANHQVIYCFEAGKISSILRRR